MKNTIRISPNTYGTYGLQSLPNATGTISRESRMSRSKNLDGTTTLLTNNNSIGDYSFSIKADGTSDNVTALEYWQHNNIPINAHMWGFHQSGYIKSVSITDGVITLQCWCYNV